MEFKLHSKYKPTGDQPQAIEQLVKGFKEGNQFETLLGVTGSGKTFTMANVIAALNKPTLIISHNKTLAGQLYGEMKEFFPENAVEYFVSYYDYYQPEAYVPQSDTYIAKDSSVNDEIDKLRLSATAALTERKDVIVVASVSCIYGLGSPDEWTGMSISLRPGQERDRDDLARALIDLQYTRNDMDFHRGTFRVHGDVLDIFPANADDTAIRVEFFGDEIDRICETDVLTGKVKAVLQHAAIFPASHYVVGDEKIEALAAIGEAEGSIDALPENPGADDYEQIVAARKAYDALPAESREKVSNLDKLEAAEKATLGVRVSRDIEALRNKEDVKSEDVEAVRKAYDALTETQRKDVTNYSDLLTLEKIVALQKELEESKKEISELKKQGEDAAAKEKAAEAAKKAKELKIAKAKKNKVTGLKLKKGKKSFKASWKKVPGVSGYRICYSTSKSFKKGCRYVVIKKSAKPKTSKSSAKKSSRRTKTVKGLKKKQKYYVRVQSFNTIDGVRVYGKWSASGSVRTK